jgi:hypothetical protein
LTAAFRDAVIYAPIVEEVAKRMSPVIYWGLPLLEAIVFSCKLAPLAKTPAELVVQTASIAISRVGHLVMGQMPVGVAILVHAGQNFLACLQSPWTAAAQTALLVGGCLRYRRRLLHAPTSQRPWWARCAILLATELGANWLSFACGRFTVPDLARAAGALWRLVSPPNLK